MRENIEQLMEIERESGIDMSYFAPGLNPETDGHCDGLIAEEQVGENDLWCEVRNWINGQLHRSDGFYWVEDGDPSVKRNILALDAAIKFDLDYIGDMKIRRRLLDIVRECEVI